MKLDKLVKYLLLKYPTLFSSRISVFMHLFSVIGNGYEWQEGELISCCDPDPTDKEVDNLKMRYDDLNKRIKETKSDKTKGLEDLNAARLVNLNFEKITRKYIEKNIEKIAADIHCLLKEEYKVHLGYYIKNPCYQYAKIFNIPTDIKEDWGDGAQEFAKFWRQRLFSNNQGFYRLLTNGKDVPIKSEKDCWSEECKKDWKLQIRLLEIINQIDINLGRKTYSEEQKEEAEYVRNYLAKKS